MRRWVPSASAGVGAPPPAVLFVRLALGAGFLSAVADRLGLWGPPGADGVAWGDWAAFLEYTALLNPYLPTSWVPAIGGAVTAAELILGVALVSGLFTRGAALGSGFLLSVFALGMTVGTGVKSALDASVLAAAGGAFLLAFAPPDPFRLDRVLRRPRDRRPAGPEPLDDPAGASPPAAHAHDNPE